VLRLRSRNWTGGGAAYDEVTSLDRFQSGGDICRAFEDVVKAGRQPRTDRAGCGWVTALPLQGLGDVVGPNCRPEYSRKRAAWPLHCLRVIYARLFLSSVQGLILFRGNSSRLSSLRAVFFWPTVNTADYEMGVHIGATCRHLANTVGRFVRRRRCGLSLPLQ